MALNNLWGKLGAFSRNVLVPSNVIYKSFDADPLVSDKMSRAISRWYGMYVDKPEWADARSNLSAFRERSQRSSRRLSLRR